MRFEPAVEARGEFSGFAFSLGTHRIVLAHNPTGISLSTCFPGDLDLMKSNQWNQTHFSTRGYVDENRCDSLASDIKYGGSPSDEDIRQFIAEFCIDVNLYSRYVPPPRPGMAPKESSPAPKPTSPIAPTAWTLEGLAVTPAPAWSDSAPAIPGLLRINRAFSLKYDPSTWKRDPSPVAGQLALSHASGDAHVIIIVEHTPLPLDSMRDIALANAQAVDPAARIVYSNRPRIDANSIWLLRFELTLDNVPMVYSGYFHGGPGGVVQVVAYTEKSRYPALEKEIADLLNGLSIAK